MTFKKKRCFFRQSHLNIVYLQKQKKRIQTKKQKGMKEIEIAKSEKRELAYVVCQNGRVDFVYREDGVEMWIMDPTFEEVENLAKKVEHGK